MTTEPAAAGSPAGGAPATGPLAGGHGGVLRELQATAAVKRAARRRVADATADLGPAAAELREHRAAHDVATARWVTLLRAAAADGHPVAVIARAAGITPASVHYRLATRPAQTSGGGDVASTLAPDQVAIGGQS